VDFSHTLRSRGSSRIDDFEILPPTGQASQPTTPELAKASIWPPIRAKEIERIVELVVDWAPSPDRWQNIAHERLTVVRHRLDSNSEIIVGNLRNFPWAIDGNGREACCAPGQNNFSLVL